MGTGGKETPIGINEWIFPQRSVVSGRGLASRTSTQGGELMPSSCCFFSCFLGVENCISYIHSLLCYLCFRAQVPVLGLRNVQFGDPANLSNVFFFFFFSAVLSQLPDRHQTAESFMSPSAEHEALGEGNSRSALN